MENTLLEEEQEIQQEKRPGAKRFVPVEWTQSEWFRIYLQMAREKSQTPDTGNPS